MESMEFVEEIRKRVVENVTMKYRDSLENTTNATDPIWNAILPIYKNMSINERDSFMEFVRLVQVNTLSHVLGIIDGSTYLNEKRESFVLTTESNTTKINGDLQDIFLSLES
jgi:hypothetical protein